MLFFRGFRFRLLGLCFAGAVAGVAGAVCIDISTEGAAGLLSVTKGVEAP